MKTNFFKSLIVAVLVTGTLGALNAQVKKHKPGPENRNLEKVTYYNGVVNKWVYNDDFVYDGFYLQTGKELILVKFPKHLGKEIRNSLSEDQVTVNGVARYNHMGEKELKFVSISSNGKTIYDIPKEKAGVPPTPKFVKGNGSIAQFQQSKKGDIVGYILNNKTILKVPPHKAAQLTLLVSLGSEVEYTGFEKSFDADEARADNYTIVKCETLTVNGEQYLIK